MKMRKTLTDNIKLSDKWDYKKIKDYFYDPTYGYASFNYKNILEIENVTRKEIPLGEFYND